MYYLELSESEELLLFLSFLFFDLLLDLYLFAFGFTENILFLCFGSFLSSGLHPKQPHILHPVEGSFVFLTSSGTWHKHDLFDFEKAFIHFLQQPFLASKFYSFFLAYFYSGLNSGSSPLLIKSSFEHPEHPHV